MFRTETEFRDVSSSFSVDAAFVTGADTPTTTNTQHSSTQHRHGVRNEMEKGVASGKFSNYLSMTSI